MNMYNLGKIKMILGILLLAAHNPEIDWEKEEVEMTCCPPICEKRKQEGKKKKVKKVKKNENEKTLRRLVSKRF